MEPQIRFCTSADGTRLGYAVLGQGPPLLVVLSWGSSIETEWENSVCRSVYERLARGRQAIVLMRRGISPSQREAEDLSLPAQVSDVAAVVDALGLERFDLWAFLDGVGPCVAYAAENPDRISRVVLWDAYRCGADIVAESAARSMIGLIRANWNLATRAMADMAFPSGPVEEQRWLSRQWHQTVTPDVAARYFEFLVGLDLRPYLPRVMAPALVLHRRGDRTVPLTAARAVAAMIPNARFLTTEGDIAYAWFGDTSYLQTVEEFLDQGRDGEKGPPEPPGPFRTILFTDIEAHTAMMQRLGDARGREVLREHERISREALKAHGGTEVKTIGDSFMASFPSAQKAVECAIALQRAFAAADCAGERLRVRVGINAGEPIAEDDDLFGSSVILASRTKEKAAGGEIFVTDVVRQLVAGKGFAFADRGEMEMKGFEEPVRLFEVRWSSTDENG